MIENLKGDLLQADAEAQVNTVNCVGVMGRGVALQFKNAYPDNYEAYKKLCDKEVIQPGSMFVFDRHSIANPRYIINFPTKRHWKGNSKIEDIVSGLSALVVKVKELGIRSIALPPLGCGLGGLKWEEVRPLIEKAFAPLSEVRVMLYEPQPEMQPVYLVKEKEQPHMTIGRAVLLRLMKQYLGAAMDTGITLLELHKMLYFMQEAGENLRLKYAKALYGPYAENLRHLLQAINGYFIKGYDGEDAPDKELQIIESVLPEAERILKDHPDTLERLQRVERLIEGFETPFSMELLATVHWVAKHEGAHSFEEATEKTYAWNERKGMFDKNQIKIAWDVLSDKDWIPQLSVQTA